MAEWSVGFYAGFDTVVEAAKEKFSGVDLSFTKAEDYTEEIGAEAGSPSAAKVSTVEFGGMNLEVVFEGEGTSGLAPIPMTIESPSPVSEISLADPLVVAASLASIDQAALSLMVISRGGLVWQTTPTL